MNAPFSLSVICVMLAMCHGACWIKSHEAKMENGTPVMPEVCVDLYDGREHPIGDKWNTAHCIECWCYTDEMRCCTHGIAHVEGCIGKFDEDTCQYKFFKADDPSKPCF